MKKSFSIIVISVLLCLFTSISGIVYSEFVFFDDDQVVLVDSGYRPRRMIFDVKPSTVFYSAPDIIYSTLGSENGLIDTYMYAHGTVLQFDETDKFYGAFIKTDRGQIYIECLKYRLTFPTYREWETLEAGQSYGVFFKYVGFYDPANMPSGIFCGIELISEEIQDTAMPSSKAWYEGGTLHQKTIGDWKTATYENKLATCADFIAAVREKLNIKITDVDSIQPYAHELVICIDTSVKDLDSMDAQKVSDIAALSFVFLEWLK